MHVILHFTVNCSQPTWLSHGNRSCSYSYGSAYEGMHFQMCSETGYFLTLLVIAATNRMRPLKCPACRGGAKKNPICLLLNKKDTSFSPVHTTCPNKNYLLFKDCQTDS